MKNLKVLFEDSAVLLDCDRRSLVVSDIHLGYELELAKKGISLPQRASSIANRLIDLGNKHEAKGLYILGDVKHKVAWASPADWFQVTTFFNRLQAWFEDIVVTLGNHDGGIRSLIPASVTMVGTRGTTIQCRNDTITLLHGNAWPGPESVRSSYVITGHGHYMIELKDSAGLRLLEPIWLIGVLDKQRYMQDRGDNLVSKGQDKDMILIILPAFNKIVGGISVNRTETRHPSPMIKYLIEERTQLYLTDGTFLTTLSKIRELERESRKELENAGQH